MADNKKRLTLDLDAPLQRRLKAVAALKGVSMRQYCQTAIEKQLSQDDINGTRKPTSSSDAFERLVALRERDFWRQSTPRKFC